MNRGVSILSKRSKNERDPKKSEFLGAKEQNYQSEEREDLVSGVTHKGTRKASFLTQMQFCPHAASVN